MDNKEIFAPKFYEIGDTFVADKCIWCFEEGPKNKTHIIPESLGGRLKPYICCVDCNSFIGTDVESYANNNLYLAAAMVKLGLRDKKRAYSKAEILDLSTGAKLKFNNNGKLVIKNTEIKMVIRR